MDGVSEGREICKNIACLNRDLPERNLPSLKKKFTPRRARARVCAELRAGPGAGCCRPNERTHHRVGVGWLKILQTPFKMLKVGLALDSI